MERQRWTDTAETRRSGADSSARDERRAAIVDAAIAAIAEHGPDALTGQIADRAGLNRTHFYRHFASKAELDWAVAKRAHLDITERIRAALVVDGTPLDAIRAPIVAHVGWADEHPNLYRFLLGRNYYRGKDMPRIGGSAFAAEISAAAVRYIPRFDADPVAADRLVVALLGLIDATVQWWLSYRDTSRAELVELLTTQAWLLIDHHLRTVGVVLDPNSPLERSATLSE
ncbi:TetR/AcrR family transcriptional regulator [Nocardia cyriacigeorgica]|uniref:TetR/AcrR family transcriptional regulator n=1 Tax=Nocardia cyriacigeorgica TaxID=135487 RepID=A0A5R8NUN5_9NOCA|nr:TetR/AcrR family transcriptional regulator [Nocardia cyriacigeorgica]TLF79407.1 TetR/AcrR family transcriptional regulator [Nocardia cyriacigeorgica]